MMNVQTTRQESAEACLKRLAPNKNTRKVWEFAEAYFQGSGCTKFPTFKEVRDATGVPMSHLESLADDSQLLMVTGYNIEDIALADLYMETFPLPSIKASQF